MAAVAQIADVTEDGGVHGVGAQRQGLCLLHRPGAAAATPGAHRLQRWRCSVEATPGNHGKQKVSTFDSHVVGPRLEAGVVDAWVHHRGVCSRRGDAERWLTGFEAAGELALILGL